MSIQINKYGELEATACPSCGDAIKADWVACPKCGRSLSAPVCDGCGKTMQDGWKTCPYCGGKTASRSGQSDSSHRAAAPLSGEQQSRARALLQQMDNCTRALEASEQAGLVAFMCGGGRESIRQSIKHFTDADIELVKLLGDCAESEVSRGNIYLRWAEAPYTQWVSRKDRDCHPSTVRAIHRSQIQWWERVLDELAPELGRGLS